MKKHLDTVVLLVSLGLTTSVAVYALLYALPLGGGSGAAVGTTVAVLVLAGSGLLLNLLHSATAWLLERMLPGHPHVKRLFEAN